jgi:tetratricopeptide (TPR) repeat protein
MQSILVTIWVQSSSSSFILLTHNYYNLSFLGLRGTIFHLRGASDLGVQMRRSGQYADAIDIMNMAILDANFMPTDILEFNVEKARAYAVKGALLHSANDYFEANVYYTKAIDLWDELGIKII